MDTALWVSLASFLAAVLSALYARWVWSEAKRTNLLALHANRLEVFRGFQALRHAVQQHGMGIQSQHVTPFYHFSREARFYFTRPKTAELLVSYFDTCFALAEASVKAERHLLERPEVDERRKKQDELSEKEQQLFKQAEQALENELLQSVRRGWHCA